MNTQNICPHCDEGVKWRQDFNNPLCNVCNGTGYVNTQEQREKLDELTETAIVSGKKKRWKNTKLMLICCVLLVIMAFVIKAW